MEANGAVLVYSVYGAISLGLTVWLARTLYRHGEAFLADVFPSREELAGSINHLLVTGFYMLNLGYALMIMRNVEANTAAEVASTLTNRLGVLLLSLGVIHFINVLVISWFRRIGDSNTALPAPPQVVVTAAEPF